MRTKGQLLWRRGMMWAGLLAMPIVSFAFDGDQSGVPAQIDAYNNNVVGFRVYLPISVGMCSGSSDNWAYLIGGTNADANYSTFVATILTAKAQGSVLRLLTRADGAGHCQIQYISIN